MSQKLSSSKRSLLAAALLGICTFTASVHATVLTSIRPLGFIASAIADGVTPTEVLLPDGASPHDYALRPSDLQRMRSADLVVWIGPEMEAFMTKPIAQLPPNRVVEIAAIPQVHELLLRQSWRYRCS